MTRQQKIQYLNDIKAGKTARFPLTKQETEAFGRLVKVINNCSLKDFCTIEGLRRAGAKEADIKVWVRFFGERWCKEEYYRK